MKAGREEKTLDQIAINMDSKRIPITKVDRTSGDYPYYGASGIVDYVADYIFDGDALLVSEDGANLLARSTPIAFSVTGKYWVNNHAHILKFDNLATQRFVELYLESIPLDEYITGAAQPKLNQKALNSIPIPPPPKPTPNRTARTPVRCLKATCNPSLHSAVKDGWRRRLVKSPKSLVEGNPNTDRETNRSFTVGHIHSSKPATYGMQSTSLTLTAKRIAK